MMEYLLTKVDHKDSAAVRTAYGIYEKTLADGYSIWDIREEIMRARQEEAVEPAIGNRSTGQMELRREKNEYQKSFKEGQADRWQPDGQRLEENPNSSYCGGQVAQKHAKKAEKQKVRKKSKVKEEKPWIQKLKKLLTEWGLLEPEEESRTETPMQQRKRPPEPIVYPEEEIKSAPEPVYRPTVCLSNMGGKPRGMLLYQGNDQLEDLCVTARMTRIGQGRDADVRIDRDTISQMHARIDHEEDSYYIEDLNSTNGTFVNDEPLPYKERRKLNSNDIVRFADIRYRFC